MRRGDFLRLLACLWAALAAGTFGAAPALAFAPGSTCQAPAMPDENAAALIADGGRWNCDKSAWTIGSPRAVIRFDLRGRDAPPQVFTTRLTGFESLTLTAVAADGGSASRTLRPDDMTRATWDWIMTAQLPRTRGPPVAIFATIDGARHTGMLTDSRISVEPVDASSRFGIELLVAAICGTVLVPLIFNIAFYRVLRERFLLWHAALVVCMIVQTVVTSGLINRIVDLPFDMILLLSVTSWGGGIIVAALFVGDLIEPGKLDAVHCRLLRLMLPWVAFWSLFYLYADGPLRPFASPLYFASFLPVLALFVWVLALARLRGGRSVNFIIVAWMPIAVTGLLRILSVIGLLPVPMELQVEQHVAIALEVIITSLGVADRFMVIRRQRDTARAKARLFEGLAERDPLTGLLNRRAIEEQFETLQAAGFHTMAVMDIDNFKAINDTHGHAVGDAVLKVVAETISADDDTIAARMGGEEFMLLLRGKDAAARAEHYRQALPVRLASAVPGLVQVVTASMGLIERRAHSGLVAEFAMIYAHCDRLLYEAKDSGRNRSMCERVQSFSTDRRPSRTAAA